MGKSAFHSMVNLTRCIALSSLPLCAFGADSGECDSGSTGCAVQEETDAGSLLQVGSKKWGWGGPPEKPKKWGWGGPPGKHGMPPWMEAAMPQSDKEAAKAWIPPGKFQIVTAPLEQQHSEPLRSLTEFRTKEGETVKLTLDAVKLPVPWVKKGEWTYTRGYNGGAPGPTIRTKAGQRIDIELMNNLSSLNNPTCDRGYMDKTGNAWEPAEICMLNSTNLHTHGLHIDPNADNMFLNVWPGRTELFVVDLVADHMAGTHWYHPHHHHSTAAQAGGGAFGMIIVEDPPNSLPDPVQNMPEKSLMVAMVNFQTLVRLEQWGTGNRANWMETENNKHDFLWQSHMGSNFFEAPPGLMVNGQLTPTMTYAPKQWYRNRFVYAAVDAVIILEVLPQKNDPNSAECEMQLLAKDGVYLNEAPRKISKIFLASGNRADVAMRCTCPSGEKCAARIRWKSLDGVPGISAQMEEMHTNMTGDLIHISVDPAAESELTKEQKVTMASLPRFKVTRPCYLADLSKVPVAKENKHKFEMALNLAIGLDGVKAEPFAAVDPLTPPIATWEIGHVYELYVTGVKWHPLHIHVMPLQVIDGSKMAVHHLTGSNYFHDGDWHDTFFSPGEDGLTLRFPLERYVGNYLLHCHKLEHEDNGMMAYLKVTGKPGTLWNKFHEYDRTCFHADDPKPGFTLL